MREEYHETILPASAKWYSHETHTRVSFVQVSERSEGNAEAYQPEPNRDRSGEKP